MRKWLRRARGVVGTGFTWAVAWGLAGTVPRWVLGFNPDAPFPIIFGVLGFFAGATFAVLLALTARGDGRRRFDQLSIARFAGWGAMAGLLLAALFARAAALDWGDLIAVAPTFAAACAACASASLALARRAERRELLEAEDVARSQTVG